MGKQHNWQYHLASGLRATGHRSYAAYLASAHWQDVRRRFYGSRLYTGGCYCCERQDVPLQIHHKTYKNLGRERLMDLVAVCGDCHRETHALIGTTSRNNIWNSVRKIRNRFKLKSH